MTVTLPAEPAAEYRTDRPSQPIPQVAQALEGRFPGLSFDPCLERAASIYGRTSRADDLPLAFSEFVLHWAGCPDPFAAVAHVLTDRSDDQDLLGYLERTLPTIDATHVGAARQPAVPPYAWRWTVFLTDRRFEMQPFPTTAPTGASAVMALRFLDPVSSATLITTAPDGAIEEHTAGLSDGHMVAVIALASRPCTQWIEVVAGTPRGPRVIVLFPVEVGRPLARTWVGRTRQDEGWITDRLVAEDHALALVQEDRARFGLTPLIPDRTLAEVARRHSAEMASTGEIAHVSEVTGSIVNRLEAAGYRAAFAAENVARSSSIGDAEEGLMRSPGHRAAILSPHATHVGIGIVRQPRVDTGVVYFITQIVARPEGGPAD